MNMLHITGTFSDVTIVGLLSIYASTFLYLIYLKFKDTNGSRRTIEPMAAVISLLLVSLLQMVIPLLENPISGGMPPLVLLPIKLFILTLVLVIPLLQTSGLLDQRRGLFIWHLCRLHFAILALDLLCAAGILTADLHSSLVLWMMACILLLLLIKFFRICIDRCEYIKVSFSREWLMKLAVLSVSLLATSYLLFISLLFKESGFLCVVSLLSVLAVQSLFFIRIVATGEHKVDNKEYIPVQAVETERLSGVVLEDKGADYQDIIERLICYFENDRPYLNCDLKIDDVSRRIYTNKTYVSRALNHGMSKNFNQFVNYYRVREACCIYIMDPMNSITDLCDKCGFKNLSSFSTAFSLHVGYTPAEWCREVKKKIVNNEKVSVEDYFS